MHASKRSAWLISCGCVASVTGSTGGIERATALLLHGDLSVT
ncbi:hypothetical protein ACQEV4_25425 [Streptomyces shenzhenensis]